MIANPLPKSQASLPETSQASTQIQTTNGIPTLSPEYGGLKFRVIPYFDHERKEFEPTRCLGIKEDKDFLEYSGRHNSYYQELSRLAQIISKELPNNVQVNFSICPWGGNAARDQVDIVVFDKKGEIAGHDSFCRSIGGSENLLSSRLIMPQAFIDKLFFARVAHIAQGLSRRFEKDPQDPKLFPKREFDGYLGVW